MKLATMEGGDSESTLRIQTRFADSFRKHCTHFPEIQNNLIYDMTSSIAENIAEKLTRLRLTVVLAESCTGGMAASLITEVPGVSECFCGSAVTYRETTKEAWLNVPHSVLKQFTAESQETSDAMAIGTLAKTPEADLCCAITGHLGPGVDPAIDGVIYLSLAQRPSTQPKGAKTDLKKIEATQGIPVLQIVRQEVYRLQSQERIKRQREAAEKMLQHIGQYLNDFEAGNTRSAAFSS
jgi:nicotinamide-nucleotide amidase